MNKSRIKIVFADANADFIFLIQEYFRFFDEFEIIGIAKNGYEILEYVSNHKVDLLVLDIVMPKLDGIQVLQQMKEIVGVTLPKVIVLSAIYQASIYNRAIELGAEMYIVKPYDFERLQCLIKNMFEMEKNYSTNLNFT